VAVVPASAFGLESYFRFRSPPTPNVFATPVSGSRRRAAPSLDAPGGDATEGLAFGPTADFVRAAKRPSNRSRGGSRGRLYFKTTRSSGGSPGDRPPRCGQYRNGRFRVDAEIQVRSALGRELRSVCGFLLPVQDLPVGHVYKLGAR
jgi:hypothetical protein